MRTQVTEGDLFFAAPIKNDVPDFLRQAAKGLLNVEVVMLGETVQHLKIKGVTPIPAGNRPRCQAQGRIMNDPLRVKELTGPEAVTVGAGPGWVIERKEPGLEFREVVASVRTGIALGEEHLLGLFLIITGQYLYQREAVSNRKRGLK